MKGKTLKKYIVFFMLLTGCVQHHANPHLDYRSEPGLIIPKLDNNSAILVFLRPENTHFSASILDGDKFVTILTDQSHFVYETTPGTHKFT